MANEKKVDSSEGYTENQVDEFMDEVSEALGQQIGDSEAVQNMGEKPKQKLRKKQIVILAILGTLVFLILMVVGVYWYVQTEKGQDKVVGLASGLIYGKLDYTPSEKKDSEFDSSRQNVQQSERMIYNIALMGSQDGNTDTMLIATLDTEQNILKLTSILRDIYVEIPNHENAKLNAAYQIGGMDRFYQTMLNNFDVSLDGYILVDYSTLEYVVDRLGGIEISLTSKEARYLNRTNYISNPAYRYVQEGSQLMNGNQVLGYCRIRSVETSNDEHYDFGRTNRQRVVLQEIYETLLSKNGIELISIMNDIINETKIKTDITEDEFKLYLTKLLQIQVKEIDMYRIPSDGTYNNEKRVIASNNSDVLIMKDWDATKEELKNILYGTNQEMEGD